MLYISHANPKTAISRVGALIGEKMEFPLITVIISAVAVLLLAVAVWLKGEAKTAIFALGIMLMTLSGLAWASFVQEAYRISADRAEAYTRLDGLMKEKEALLEWRGAYALSLTFAMNTATKDGDLRVL